MLQDYGAALGITLATIGVVICPITSVTRHSIRSSDAVRLVPWTTEFVRKPPEAAPHRIGAILGIGNVNWSDRLQSISGVTSACTNQTLASDRSGSSGVPVLTEKKNLIAAVPVTFMSAVSCTYFIPHRSASAACRNSKTVDGEYDHNAAVAYPIGIVFVALLSSHRSSVRPRSAAKKSLNIYVAAGRSFVRSAAAIHNDNCG